VTVGVFRALLSIPTLLTLFLLPVSAPVAADRALLAIVIDDLGNERRVGERAARLPGPVTCSVLPHTPYARELAGLCKEAGKEVLLHLPMQPQDSAANPGPGVLLLGQRRAELRQLVADGLAAVPGADGVNNHMGSLLTRHIGYMHWLMADLSRRPNLVFIDSMTTSKSRALTAARAHGMPSTRRDLFLDDDPSPEAVRRQWQRLIRQARAEGSALGIGHPRSATLDVLATELEALDDEGIILVGVADLIRFRESAEPAWAESLSLSRMASKR
jgi:polysaccharide deacetylase 2 family uncharacterized protein YibQ